MPRRSKATPLEMSRARLELRIDADVVSELQKLAERVGVSVNQLMQGIARWAVGHAHPGEADVDDHGIISTRPQLGCVWFGKDETEAEDEQGFPHLDPGYVAFSLDFTERR